MQKQTDSNRRKAPLVKVSGTTIAQQERWKKQAKRMKLSLSAWLRAAAEAFVVETTHGTS